MGIVGRIGVVCAVVALAGWPAVSLGQAAPVQQNTFSFTFEGRELVFPLPENHCLLPRDKFPEQYKKIERDAQGQGIIISLSVPCLEISTVDNGGNPSNFATWDIAIKDSNVIRIPKNISRKEEIDFLYTNHPKDLKTNIGDLYVANRSNFPVFKILHHDSNAIYVGAASKSGNSDKLISILSLITMIDGYLVGFSNMTNFNGKENYDYLMKSSTKMIDGYFSSQISDAPHESINKKKDNSWSLWGFLSDIISKEIDENLRSGAFLLIAGFIYMTCKGIYNLFSKWKRGRAPD